MKFTGVVNEHSSSKTWRDRRASCFSRGYCCNRDDEIEVFVDSFFTPMIVLDDLSYHDCAFQDKGTQKTGAPVVSKLLTVCPTLRKLDLSGLYKWSVVFSRF